MFTIACAEMVIFVWVAQTVLLNFSLDEEDADLPAKKAKTDTIEVIKLILMQIFVLHANSCLFVFYPYLSICWFVENAVAIFDHLLIYVARHWCCHLVVVSLTKAAESFWNITAKQKQIDCEKHLKYLD